jgi:hypothetical protein
MSLLPISTVNENKKPETETFSTTKKHVLDIKFSLSNVLQRERERERET